MDRRRVLKGLAGASAWAAGAYGAAQPRAQAATVAWVTAAANNAPTALAAFRAGLADRGWSEGRNLELVMPGADRSDARRLYDEMVAAGAEVVVATGALGPPIALLARDVPVVFAAFGDPVVDGLVVDPARPHANRTGMTVLAYDLMPKRVELLRQAAPQIRRAGFLYHAQHAGAAQEVRAAEQACRDLGLELRVLPLAGGGDLDAAFGIVERERLDALLTAVDGVVGAHAKRIADFAIARRLPVASGWDYYARAGYLMSYGAGLQSLYHYLAGYVDKLLRGARPADLPVERAPKVELVVNLKTADAIGLQLPATLLARADEILR